MIKIFKAVLELYYRIPWFFVRCLLKKEYNPLNKMMIASCSAAEKYTDGYISYRLRPNNILVKPVLNLENGNSKLAVVIQGPVVTKDDFTLKTALYYKKCNPDAIIILSTWSNTNQECLNKFIKSDIDVVLSELPKKSGSLNINFQIKNSLAGVKRARELGAEFVCKTRTDQRIDHPDAFRYFELLINLFPVNNDDFVKNQKRRIIATCMPYGDLFYPYHISDFLYFGNIDDMEILFSLEEDNRDKGEWAQGLTKREIAKGLLAPEIQIMRSFIEKMGGCNECSIEAYWRFVKNHLVCLNSDEIELFWPKYESRYSENRAFGHYFENDDLQRLRTYNFDFIRWLELYSGKIVYKKDYERYADIIK